MQFLKGKFDIAQSPNEAQLDDHKKDFMQQIKFKQIAKLFEDQKSPKKRVRGDLSKKTCKLHKTAREFSTPPPSNVPVMGAFPKQKNTACIGAHYNLQLHLTQRHKSITPMDITRKDFNRDEAGRRFSLTTLTFDQTTEGPKPRKMQ